MQSRQFLQPIWRSLTIRVHPSSTLPRCPSRLIQRSRPFSQTSFRANNWPRPPPGTHKHNNDPHYQLAHAKPLVTPGRLRRFVRSPTLRTVVVLSIVGAVVFYVSNIQTVPVSGRRRFNCFSDESVEAASQAQVKRLLWEIERSGQRFLSDWDPRMMMVRRVMNRLIPVSGMEDADWEIRVIDDPRM